MKKVAILGGGPAGLAAAIQGAKNGISVALYEKYKIGDNIRCAEGYFDTLNMLGEPEYGVRFKVQALELELKSKYLFPCDDKMNIWMIDRPEWQRGLASDAKKLGVNIIENFPITRENYKKITSKYDFVIDSTGVPSITSIVKGFSNYYKGASAVTVQYTMEGDFSHMYGKLKLGLEEHRIGYNWIFPKSETEANVGVGYFDECKFNLWEELNRIVKKEGLASYKITKKLGGLCPVVKLDRLLYDNVLLTGDAAGLTSPIHGGGIDMACISGKLAMQSILMDTTNNYETELNRILGRKLKEETELRELWEKFVFDDVDYLFKVIHDSNIKLSDCGFFTGDIHLLKKLKHIKHFLTPGRKNIYLIMARNLLPAKAVEHIFKFLLT